MVTQEIIDYIRKQIASGQSIESISNVLISQHWTKEDINEAINKVISSNNVISHNQVNPIKSKRKLLIVIIFILLIGFLVYVGLKYYFTSTNLSYSDPKYGFTITDQRGWGKPKIKSNVYYALGTFDGTKKTVISSFNVNPIKKDGTETQKRAIFQDFCNKTASEGLNPKYKVEGTQVNGMSGYLCTYETRPTNVDILYNFRIYLLLHSPNQNYDYIISISYPQNNPIEEQKVNAIINSFFVK